jgi:hypothetical protein
MNIRLNHVLKKSRIIMTMIVPPIKAPGRYLGHNLESILLKNAR